MQKSLAIFVFSLFLLCLGAVAQKVTYSEPDHDDARTLNFEIVGKMNGNILIYKNYRDLHYMAIYDAEMRMTEKNRLDFLPEKLINVEFIQYPDFIYFFYQYQKKSVYYAMVAKLDPSGKKIGQPIQLDTTAEVNYASFQNYASLKDTLFNQDKNDAIAEMQAKFDVEKNQQKVTEIELKKKIDDEANTKQRLLFIVVIIVILISLVFTMIVVRNKQKVNSLLEQKNTAIQANLEQKEVMMSEIHHRVKNNLQMVSSILDLQARDLTDEKSMRVIEDSLSRINAISLIHQRLYQSDNIRGIKINTYLQELAFDILKNFSSSVTTTPIQLTCKVDDLNMDLESAIPIGLITAELITNACKYAFLSIEKPEITITLNKQQDALVLIVTDNGVGKQAAVNESGTSFGTKLIKSLSRKLRAEIIEDTSNKGTSIQLKINSFKLYDI